MSPTAIPGNLILQSPTANDPLLDLNTQPSLDLQFATSKTLDDRVSGLPLVDHQRDASGSNSPGTYVGSDGLIKTSPVNLLTYSEQFDNSAWIKTNVALDTTVAAPNGELSAQKIKENSTTNSLHSVNISAATLMNGVYTFSVYAKASERSIIALNFTYANGVFSTSDSRAWFNLSNGTVGTTANVSSATIDPVGSSGWYRCTLVSQSFSSANRKVLVATSITDGSVTHNGDGTSGVYLWGAQLEEGTTATDYIPTTSTISGAPRFDHDPATGESLGLLIEESRTNLVPNSAGDVLSSVQSMTGPTSVTGPAGSDTAFQYLSIGGNVASRIVISNSVNVTTGNQYTATIYVKGVNYNTVAFGFSSAGFPSQSRRSFNLDTLTSQGGGAGAVETSIEDVGNGWRRLRMTTVAANADTSTVLYLDLGTASFETHTTDEGFQVYGIQVEEGSFATSYIPTEGSTVTRAADVAEITGTNFSSWYNQDEGTVFASFDSAGGSPSRAAYGLGSSTAAQGTNGPNDPAKFNWYDGSSNIQTANEVDFTTAARKTAASFTDTEVSVCLEGGAVVTGTQSSVTETKIHLGARQAGVSKFLNGHIKRLTYYPYRLPDATLQEITS